QQINHPCFDAIAPNKALLARAGGLCPCSPTLQGAGFLKVLFFGVPLKEQSASSLTAEKLVESFGINPIF
ncbi:hypothetical protein, partial [Oscillatoria sp. HE19RPO]|uniref:hypothetical protein n=1 Tax=Oscillatoria sp. HE19RPO TaxID=2954806 RepID=UPI0020C4EB58